MIPSKQKLLVEQIDRKLSDFQALNKIKMPERGWLRTIRTALKMSLRQLGSRLNISAQSVKELEDREANGSITIKSLREVGEALNMKLIYGFSPTNDNIETMIEKRAYEIAKGIVMRTSATMSLEDQENSQERLKSAIRNRADEIKSKLPTYLWD